MTVNGWTLYAHPLFLDQLEDLLQAVEKARLKDPAGYTRKNATKRLAAVAKLAFEVIPQDPERPDYRQGDTIGEDRKHWMRAKIFQQYRLFFRFRKLGVRKSVAQGKRVIVRVDLGGTRRITNKQKKYG